MIFVNLYEIGPHIDQDIQTDLSQVVQHFLHRYLAWQGL